MGIIVINPEDSGNVPTPPAGSIALYVDPADGFIAYKDETGSVVALPASPQGEPGEPGEGLLWRRNWGSGVQYNKNDVVRRPPAGEYPYAVVWVAVSDLPPIGVAPELDDGTNWILFVRDGENGQDGAPGTNGTNGTAGVDGKTLRNGAGAPSNGLGVDGDFYIDTTAKAIYGPKASGTWGSATSLVGPPGADGEDGTGDGGGSSEPFVWEDDFSSNTLSEYAVLQGSPIITDGRLSGGIVQLPVAFRNASAKCKINFGSSTSGAGLLLAMRWAQWPTDPAYMVYAYIDASALGIGRLVNGQYTGLSQVSYSPAPNTNYWAVASWSANSYQFALFNVDPDLNPLAPALASVGGSPSVGDLPASLQPNAYSKPVVRPPANGWLDSIAVESLSGSGGVSVGGVGVGWQDKLIADWDPAINQDTDGTSVAKLKDSSYGGFDLEQATSGARPTIQTVNAKRVLRFDGSDDYLTSNLTGVDIRFSYPFTNVAFTAVLTANTSSGFRSIFATQITGGVGFRIDQTSRVLSFNHLANAAINTGAIPVALNTRTVVTATYSSLYECTLWVNGVKDTTTTVQRSITSYPLYLGYSASGSGESTFSGDIYRAIVHRGVPDIAEVHADLMDEYGIS